MNNQAATLPLEQACRDFAQCILALTEEQFISPMDGWAPRDVVAHLVGWNGLMIEAASSILAGTSPAYYADAHNDYRNINAAFTAAHASHSRPELLKELQTSLEILLAFLHSLPAGELQADHGVVHHSGGPATVARLIQSLAGDYRSHTRQIEEWFGGERMDH